MTACWFLQAFKRTQDSPPHSRFIWDEIHFNISESGRTRSVRRSNITRVLIQKMRKKTAVKPCIYSSEKISQERCLQPSRPTWRRRWASRSLVSPWSQGYRRTTRGPRPALLGRGPAAVVRLAYSPQDWLLFGSSGKGTHKTIWYEKMQSLLPTERKQVLPKLWRITWMPWKRIKEFVKLDQWGT